MGWNAAARSRSLTGACVLEMMLTLGCASPGPPRPPSLHLPDLAFKLEAQRVADEVRLTWLTPAKTTDGIAIRGPLTAVVCREGRQTGAMAQSMDACSPVRRMAVIPGPAEMTDALPNDLRRGAATQLVYRIELLNDAGRSAGKSDGISAAGGQAPAPMTPLAISPRRGTALIQWRAPQAGSATEATVELRRTLVASLAPSESSTSKPASHPVVPARRPLGALKVPAKTTFGAGEEPPSELTLIEEATAPGADAGGMQDPTVRDGDTYRYIAQRVRKLSLNGENLEMRGVASPPATFTYRDTFPPDPPSGLVSVPGAGAVGEVDLSWEPSPEVDLLGYNVYRQVGTGAFTKLSPQAVPSSSFRDTQVAPGHAYSYRVTAVDRRGNESAPSSEVHESLRQ